MKKIYYKTVHLYENIITNLWCDDKILIRSIPNQFHK